MRRNEYSTTLITRKVHMYCAMDFMLRDIQRTPTGSLRSNSHKYLPAIDDDQAWHA